MRWLILLLTLLLTGCVTMSRDDALKYCMNWAREQVAAGTYSHGIEAYSACMGDVGHRQAVENRRDCGISGLRCPPRGK